jgi:hypothetical protein
MLTIDKCLIVVPRPVYKCCEVWVGNRGKPYVFPRSRIFPFSHVWLCGWASGRRARTLPKHIYESLSL